MPLPDKRLLLAAHVAPMTSPTIRDGGVVIAEGRIVAVGDGKSLRRDHPDAVVEDLGGVVLMPGLVNAHTHLELTHVTRPPAPPAAGGFVDWIMHLMAQVARTGEAAGQAVAAAVVDGRDQSLRFGVTTVGDITKQCAFSRPALRDGPLRVVSYGELQAMAQRRSLLDARFAAATDCAHDSPWLRVGVTPHAPYTVEPDGYTRALDFARRHGRPIATHLAENPEEAEFLAEQTGPFRRLWEIGVNAWDEHVPRFTGGPIRFARSVGLLDHPTLLAHVNYCDDDELALLARGRASVVYCPRTHAYFGHGPHRWRDMLAAGVNVALGTDSCASSPDLNLVDDLRLVHEIAPNVPVAELWKLVTINGARAVEMADTVGSLEPGKAADLVAFDVAGDDPLREILETARLPRRVWIAGRPVGRT